MTDQPTSKEKVCPSRYPWCSAADLCRNCARAAVDSPAQKAAATIKWSLKRVAGAPSIQLDEVEWRAVIDALEVPTHEPQPAASKEIVPCIWRAGCDKVANYQEHADQMRTALLQISVDEHAPKHIQDLAIASMMPFNVARSIDEEVDRLLARPSPPPGERLRYAAADACLDIFNDMVQSEAKTFPRSIQIAWETGSAIDQATRATETKREG